MPIDWLTAKIALVALVFTMTGCALSPKHIARQVQITGDKYDSHIKYTGPKISAKGKRSYPSDLQLVFLYAERSRKTNEVSYFVRADVLYPSGWRFYRKVSFADSSQRDIDTLWSAKNPCGKPKCLKIYSARFPVTLDRLFNRPELEFRLETITGKTNEFSIPRRYIEGFVLAVKGHMPASASLGPKSGYPRAPAS